MDDAELKSIEDHNSYAEYERNNVKEWDEEEEWEQTKKINSDITEKVKNVNALLKKWEPMDVSYDSYGDYTGYKPQFQIDAMNAIFGFDGWSFREISNTILKNKDNEAYLTVANVEVSISGVSRTASAYGQSRVTKGDIGDAMKGAQTDAIKKALSYFSIGNRAYRGELPRPNGSVKRQNAPQSKEAAQSYGSTRPASEAQINAIITMKTKLREVCDNNELKMLSSRQASVEIGRLKEKLEDAKDNEDKVNYED